MQETLFVRCITCGMYGANAWLVGLPERDDALLIDPGDDLDALEAAIAQSGKKLSAILLTHGHFDHTLAAGELSRRHGAQIYIHAGDLDMVENERLNVYNPAVSALPAPANFGAKAFAAADGEKFTLCGVEFALLHTPGHTPGCACFYAEEHSVLFSGDTLFASGFGRTDLPGGSMAQLRKSLIRLLQLPGEVQICPGHGGTSTIARERRVYGFESANN